MDGSFVLNKSIKGSVWRRLLDFMSPRSAFRPPLEENIPTREELNIFARRVAEVAGLGA